MANIFLNKKEKIKLEFGLNSLKLVNYFEKFLMSFNFESYNVNFIEERIKNV